ncbi:sugar kinase [Tessaracoccus sp. Y36]
MTDVWTFGETMVSLRTTAVLSPGVTWSTHVAGAESTVAIGLARLGHSVTWCSRLGDDAFGHLVTRELRAEGVAVDCALDPERPTGFMFLRPTAFAAEVAYHRAGSAASALGVEVVDSLVATAPRVVVLSGITPALGPGPAEATARAVESAHALGATVVLDVNHRSRLWSRDAAARFLRRIIPGVDLVVGSPEELELLASTPQRLLELGPSQVVVKLGAQGARLHTDGSVVDGPTTPVPVLDPVGAGDAFTAGYVSALLEGAGSAARLRRGNVMGAAAVRHRGDYEGLPLRDELLAWEREGGADVLR